MQGRRGIYETPTCNSTTTGLQPGLRNDRMELRRDLRNGASKAEILKDRQEIRGDLKEIRQDRVDLHNDQAKLDTARRELRSDIHKR